MVAGYLHRVKVSSLLILHRWAEAAVPARELVRGRPRPDDKSRRALDDLASGRALAGVALARGGFTEEARALLDLAKEPIEKDRATGASNPFSRYAYALVTFGRGLVAPDRLEQQRIFTAVLAEITSMAAEPQKLRSVRELRTAVEQELARLGGAD